MFLLAHHQAAADPDRRVQVFTTFPRPVATLDEAVKAARAHYATLARVTPETTHRVYRSEDGHAVIEVADGSPFRVLGLYKVAPAEEPR